MTDDKPIQKAEHQTVMLADLVTAMSNLYHEYGNIPVFVAQFPFKQGKGQPQLAPIQAVGAFKGEVAAGQHDGEQLLAATIILADKE